MRAANHAGTPILPQATTRGAPLYVYPTQFFPGTPSAAQATTLTLKSGEERSGVDLTLSPAKTARVSGNVLGPDGPVANVALRLVPEGDDFATELETVGDDERRVGRVHVSRRAPRTVRGESDARPTASEPTACPT